jgi:hypothetical protein
MSPAITPRPATISIHVPGSGTGVVDLFQMRGEEEVAADAFARNGDGPERSALVEPFGEQGLDLSTSGEQRFQMISS